MASGLSPTTLEFMLVRWVRASLPANITTALSSSRATERR